MNKKKEKLLQADLCARLVYGVKVRVEGDYFYDEMEPYDCDMDASKFADWLSHSYTVKPYLRLLTSMTEDERKYLRNLVCYDYAPKDCPVVHGDFSMTTMYSCQEREVYEHYDMEIMLPYIQFLNEHHFDWHGLIKKGLALEAPEGLYKIKKATK